MMTSELSVLPFAGITVVLSGFLLPVFFLWTLGNTALLRLILSNVTTTTCQGDEVTRRLSRHDGYLIRLSVISSH